MSETPKATRKRKLSVESVAEALRQFDGNMAAVARAYGCDRSSVWRYVEARPELQEVAREARESMKDDAESSLYTKVREGEGWAVCFYLKTQAKDRGYVERHELEQSGSLTLGIVEEIVDRNPEAIGEDGTPTSGAVGVP